MSLFIDGCEPLCLEIWCEAWTAHCEPPIRSAQQDSRRRSHARKHRRIIVARSDRRRLFESFVRLSLALSDRVPLVLFVDDMQWADGATLDLLQYATRRWQESATRIVLLISLRSEALLPVSQLPQAGLIEWLGHMEREIPTYHLELEPLGQPDTVQMVLSILAPPAPDFAEWVFSETRGQPFYLMETLKDLLERGALHPKRQAELALP